MTLLTTPLATGRRAVLELLDILRTWPWFETLRTLRERFREDRLGLTASSLTFTTLISLVPLLSVMLAVFTAFPMFHSFQGALEKYFLQSLVPPAIARPVLNALTVFATKASRVGTAGLLALVFTAMALMLTIDRTLNAIWRVPKPRPIAQRVLVYWAAVTLGPLVLGASLTLTSYAVSASSGLVRQLPGGVSLMLGLIEFAALALAASAMFHYVPHAPVAWRHAGAGGVFVGVGFEAAKKGLGWYLSTVASYSSIYGAFATVPIFLLWIDLSWIIVLLGAVIAAYAPSLGMRMVRHGDRPGQPFALALEVLKRLWRSRMEDADAPRGPGARGLDGLALARGLRIDPLQIQTALEALLALDWIGRLDEPGDPRYVLLCDPQRTPLAPLVDVLLMAPVPTLATPRRCMRVEDLTLRDVL